MWASFGSCRSCPQFFTLPAAATHRAQSLLLLLLLGALPPCIKAAADLRVHRQHRLLQGQAITADNQELPRVIVGKVKATVTNTYSWTIERQSTASGVAVSADAYNRKQLGYTLTFLRSLSKTEYRLNGVITVTNPSGQGTAGLISVLLVLGSREVNVACQGMPADQQPYTLQPATVIECPFSQTWGTEPGTDTVSAYVQTSFGRAQAVAPVAFAFRQCGAAAADGSSLWAPCEVVERAACVSVTDGSYIVNKYRDTLGQSLAGPVSRSRLFDTSPIHDSQLGPARMEPTLPATPPPAAAPARGGYDTPPEWKPAMPDHTWFTGTRHRRQLLLLQEHHQHHQHQQQQQKEDVGHSARIFSAGASAAHSSSSGGRQARRHLLQAEQEQQQQQQQPGSPPDVDGASAIAVQRPDAMTFSWPYPQIAGDRPPLGLGGKAVSGADKQVCDSASFSFSMIWGPLLPTACGTYEVQNFAAALPTDGSAAAVNLRTITYLQVLCPAAMQGTTAAAGAAPGAAAAAAAN